MTTTLVQVRVDENLKKDVADIYSHYGLDLPTAIRIFFKKTQAVHGLPFDLRDDNNFEKANNSAQNINWESFVVAGSERGKNVDAYMKEMRDNDRL